MKLLASSAAFFVWMQFAICGLAVAEVAPAGAEGRHGVHAARPDVSHSEELESPNPHRHAGGSHHHETQPGSTGEDHCDLQTRSLTSSTTALGALVVDCRPDSIRLPSLGRPCLALAVRDSLRAPPKPPDLTLQKSSFLL